MSFDYASYNGLILFCDHFYAGYSVKNKILFEQSEFILFRNRQRKIAKPYSALIFLLRFFHQGKK